MSTQSAAFLGCHPCAAHQVEFFLWVRATRFPSSLPRLCAFLSSLSLKPYRSSTRYPYVCTWANSSHGVIFQNYREPSARNTGRGRKIWTLCCQGTQTWWDSLEKGAVLGCLTPWTTCLFGEKEGSMHFVNRKTFHNVKTKSTRKPRVNTSPPSSQSREGGVPGL